MCIIGQQMSYAILIFVFQAAMDDENRVVFSSMADTFRVVNYSLNFYLYCVANDDIRKAAYSVIANSFCFGKRV